MLPSLVDIANRSRGEVSAEACFAAFVRMLAEGWRPEGFAMSQRFLDSVCVDESTAAEVTRRARAASGVAQ